MKISFFEEFPNKNTLSKLSLISFHTTIYVAARSIKDLKKITKSCKNVQISYWPILDKKEGYWLSPFSSPKAINRILNEIDNYKKPINIMWDAELPFRHPWLFLRIDNYIRNMSKIKKFFKNNGSRIFTSEYPVRNRMIEFLFRFLGVYFSPKRYNNTKIIMYYTSMHKLVARTFYQSIIKIHEKYGEQIHVGLGTITTGILGNEPILTPSKLEKDLEDMKKIGISEVVIFRLGGLNKEYVKVINKFTTNA